jgi:O-methyltransferase
MLNLLTSRLKRLLESFGLNIRRVRAFDNCNRDIFPKATYSPWLQDETFLSTYNLISSNTLVDIYRLYELWKLLEEVKDIPGDVLEVGVWRGGTGCLLATCAKNLSIDGTIYLCDTFSGVVKAGNDDATYRGGEHSDTSEDLVRKLLSKLSLDNFEILKGIFPDATSDAISNNTFRLCHIDVDVKKSADDILSWVWPRLATGGVIVYDDYGFYECDGIRCHVDEQRKKSDRLVIHNLNGHAIIIKIRE